MTIFVKTVTLMRAILVLFFSCFILLGCGSSKKAYKKPSENKTDRIIQQAQSFAGTRYKYGGTTKRGMDCSGLVYIAFQNENMVLPRTSSAMSKKGKPISKSKIRKGDLVFFKTNKSRRKINHVGLVTAVDDGVVYFMHATTSRGVMTSTLDDVYWRKAYAEARRVL